MKVIVVGAGEVGTYVADRLNRHHEVSLLEKNPERFNQIERDHSLDVLTILGSGTDPDALKRAGVEEAVQELCNSRPSPQRQYQPEIHYNSQA